MVLTEETRTLVAHDLNPDLQPINCSIAPAQKKKFSSALARKIN